MDFSKYENTNTPTPTTTISTPVEQDKLNASAVITVCLVGVAMVASGVAALPGVISQVKINSEVAGRLQEVGLTKMSDSEAVTALNMAIPMTEPGAENLIVLRWEDVINNNDLGPGIYFGLNIIVDKQWNGRGRGVPSDSMVRHRYANISPEQAMTRYRSYLKGISP